MVWSGTGLPPCLPGHQHPVTAPPTGGWAASGATTARAPTFISSPEVLLSGRNRWTITASESICPPRRARMVSLAASIGDPLRLAAVFVRGRPSSAQVSLFFYLVLCSLPTYTHTHTCIHTGYRTAGCIASRVRCACTRAVAGRPALVMPPYQLHRNGLACLRRTHNPSSPTPSCRLGGAC